MECKHCGTWMVDPRGGMGKWVYGYTSDGFTVIDHSSTHDYVCPKCRHREHVERAEHWQSKKRFWEHDNTATGVENDGTITI